MPTPAIIAGTVPVLFAAYFLLLAPGQAWWKGRESAAPRLFVRVAVSAAWTTAVGLGLIVAESFSLPRLIVINAVSALLGFLWFGRIRIDGVTLIDTGRASALVALLALCAYWPPFEVHIAASDATTYVDAGIHLARNHRLAKTDDVGESLSPFVGVRLFDSIFGGGWKPPYHRVPGGMIVPRRHAPEAYPSFFPAPMVWAAVFADAIGARRAGGYAAMFCALAVWGCWLIARKRLGFAAAAVTTALIALNAASFWAGRMPLSEPLVWAFLWAGLVAYDAWEEEGLPADARLAGCMLGAAALVRLELAAFLAVIIAGRHLFGGGSGLRRLTFGFYATFALAVGGSFAAAHAIPGGYSAPFFQGFELLHYLAWRTWQNQPLLLAATGVVAAGLAAISLRKKGLGWSLAAAVFAGGIFGYLRTSHFEGLRSMLWLGSYLGWATLALVTAGVWTAWTRRHARPADTFFVLAFGVFAFLLIYDPHVMPFMPWASRRFVPMVIPAGLILAGMAASRIRLRNGIAGTVAWVVLTASVIAPAHYVLTHDFFRGTYDQLEEFGAMLPEKGTFFIDEALRDFMFGVPVWLLFDHNNIMLQTTGRRGESMLRALTHNLHAKHGPIYLLKPALSRNPKPPLVKVAPVDGFVFSWELPYDDPIRPPQERRKYTMPVAILELTPIRLPRPPGPPKAQGKPPAATPPN